jgi:hypothetical protein
MWLHYILTAFLALGLGTAFGVAAAIFLSEGYLAQAVFSRVAASQPPLASEVGCTSGSIRAHAEPLGYAPLPHAIASRSLSVLDPSPLTACSRDSEALCWLSCIAGTIPLTIAPV